MISSKMMLTFCAVKLYSAIILLTVIILFVTSIEYLESAKALESANIFDSNLKVEVIFQKEIKHDGGDLSPVSSMTFLGANDILLLNKNNGIVHRIVNGVLLNEPLLDVNVANKRERGMLGIATITPSIQNYDKDDITKYVFLYYTESNKDGNDVCPLAYYCEPSNDPLGNRLYRYELQDEKLVNPKLFLDLPATPGPIHNGGAVEIGPDNNVYVTIGDVHGHADNISKTKAQNFQNGSDPDGRSGILRITPDGKFVNGDGIFGDNYPLKFYYAYGIRNSFGIDFDPVSGKLWDTENGPDYADEINIVDPGFNSGWIVLQGMWKPSYDEVKGGDFIAGDELLDPINHELVDFYGKGKYSAPEFIWKIPVGPTAIKFFDSEKYGKEYKNDLFVGDASNGYLYHFDLNNDRTGLVLKGKLLDKIADTNTPDELSQIKIGEGFGGITDIEVSPDGYLYILSKANNKANIFKINSVNSRE